jgi:hypothetical protein
MASGTAVSDLLARFPGPLTLCPSRRKWLIVLVGSALFTAGGVWMIREGDPSGWFVAAFFGLCAIIGIVMLLPGLASLTLDADGFEMTSFFVGKRIRWRDASNFAASRIPPAFTKLVVFDNAKDKSSAVGRLNRMLVQHNAGLGDTYGLAADDLARLMAQWRERAIRSR